MNFEMQFNKQVADKDISYAYALSELEFKSTIFSLNFNSVSRNHNEINNSSVNLLSAGFNRF